MAKVFGFVQRDARKLADAYREKDHESPTPDRIEQLYLREIDVGSVAGTIPSLSQNVTVTSSYRSDPTQPGQMLQYDNVINPYTAEIEVTGQQLTVVIARILTGQWIILTADCQESP